MNKIFLIAVFVLATLTSIAQDVKPEWRQIEKTVESETESPRSLFMSYGNRDLAVTGDFSKSEFFISLSKAWKFSYAEDQSKLPANFNKPTFDDKGWRELALPSNWELAGYGKAGYRVEEYSLASSSDTSLSAASVPVGIYRTSFNIPFAWLDRDIFLRLGGAKSGTYVYINGQKAGYTDDSKCGAEFRINKFVKDGSNTIVLEVHKSSEGSLLENHNTWDLSGVDREIYLFSQPKTHIEDFYVTQTLDPTYANGIFKLEVCMVNSFNRASGDMQVWFELEDAQGKVVDYHYQDLTLSPEGRDTVRLERTIKNVRKWSAEDPYLYNLVIKVRKEGSYVEYTSHKVGFRKSEIREKQFLFNGKPTVVRGVNYHEFDPPTGHVVSESAIIKDMEMMKRANINTIRLPYPHQRKFYELADKYGFYVIDAVSISTSGLAVDRGRGKSVANNPQLLPEFMERTQSAYHRTKNNPCIIAWSLGNDAGNGYNFYKTYQWLKSVESERSVIYDGAGLEWNSDMVLGTIRTSAEAIQDCDRPFLVLLKPAHISENRAALNELSSSGPKNNGYCGAIVMDWADQGLAEYNSLTKKSDLMFSKKDNRSEGGMTLRGGIVNSDRTPKPMFYEVCHVFGANSKAISDKPKVDTKKQPAKSSSSKTVKSKRK